MMSFELIKHLLFPEIRIRLLRAADYKVAQDDMQHHEMLEAG